MYYTYEHTYVRIYICKLLHVISFDLTDLYLHMNVYDYIFTLQPYHYVRMYIHDLCIQIYVHMYNNYVCVYFAMYITEKASIKLTGQNMNSDIEGM